jgi:hypothetical protein
MFEWLGAEEREDNPIPFGAVDNKGVLAFDATPTAACGTNSKRWWRTDSRSRDLGTGATARPQRSRLTLTDL